MMGSIISPRKQRMTYDFFVFWKTVNNFVNVNVSKKLKIILKYSSHYIG